MKRKNAGTSLFLMEMIIIILFFSVASAVCIQSFVNAHLLDKHTMELNHAVIIAQGFADVMRGTDATLESLLDSCPTAVREGDAGLLSYYDENFKPCSEGAESVYLADLTLGQEEKLRTVTISVRTLEDNTEIYTLTATKYIGNL